MPNVFIAPKIKVGFQKRTDTFTGMLAYIIYYDEKGKLRKEKSWEGWRDKKIDAQEFENVPTDGFTINKDIKRYSGERETSSDTAKKSKECQANQKAYRCDISQYPCVAFEEEISHIHIKNNSL
jgi:hypothetical protein